MRDLLADAGHALRALRRRPGAMVVPVLTIALAIGASTAIFSALYVALFGPLPYREPGRLVMGRATFSGVINPWVAAPDFYDYRERNRVLESLSAYLANPQRMTVLGAGESESVLTNVISWDLFRTLGVNPRMGRHFTPDEGELGGRDVAIISHGYWQRAMGGARDVIGRTLVIGGRPRTIVGLMPAGFHFAFAIDVWLPMQRGGPSAGVRRFHNWMLVGRLKPGVTLAQAQRQIDAISVQLEKEYPDSNRTKALLLTDLQQALTEGDRPSLVVLMAAVGVLLLVACADVAGLLLSRGSARQAEMAIRTALGATRAHLVRQLLTESMLVALLAGGFGVVLAFWLRALMVRFFPLDALGITQLPINGPVLGFAATATIATSALFGIVPALVGSRADSSQEFKAGARSTEARSRMLFRHGLVAVQVAMSVVLLAIAALLGRSLMELKAVDLGFATENLLTAELQLSGAAYGDPAARIRFFTGLMEDFRAVPGVEGATIINNLPIRNPANNIPVWDMEHPPAQASEASMAFIRVVLPGYFRTMGIPILAGRDVATSDTADRPPVAVISRATARMLFPGANPLGRRIALFTGEAQPAVVEVVGMVADVHVNGAADGRAAAIYAPYQIAPSPMMRIAVRTSGTPASVAGALRVALGKRDRGLALADVKTMDAVIAESLRDFSTRAGALVLFSAAALLLAMLGVYGVLAFTVSRRRHEIGVRIVVGATRANLARWVLGRGLLPVAVGLVLGLAGALGAGQLVRSLLFNVRPVDMTTLVGVVLFLGLAAVAACLLPAWRAMRVDPCEALRYE